MTDPKIRLDLSHLDRRQWLMGLGATFAAAFITRGARATDKPALLMIDAGHGGKDPGAIGVTGLREKDVTLSIVQAIRDRLRDQKGLRVRLTRDDDRFLPLGQRVRLAHQAQADFFVSIHADAAPNRQARGLSAYSLSETASDALADALAERENRVDRLYGVDLSGTDKETVAILMDLAVRHKETQSLTAKRGIVQGVSGRSVRLLDNPMRSANFAVLKSPQIPSVLIETGFLTNTDDEALLANMRTRRDLAYALGEEIAEAAIKIAAA